MCAIALLHATKMCMSMQRKIKLTYLNPLHRLSWDFDFQYQGTMMF